MKRLHVHVGVDDLHHSVRFYSIIFATEPTVLKQDYAKWMLNDPRVNFAISVGQHPTKGVQHLGIQVDSTDELGEVYGRLKAAERPVLEGGRTTCCYARSEKSWISDPDGLVWETFYTDGEATAYGYSPALRSLSDSLPEDTCCLPKATL